ncbi:MAG: hypothetical protein EOO39_22680, partial [Cytophagaceae bacterium]
MDPTLNLDLVSFDLTNSGQTGGAVIIGGYRGNSYTGSAGDDWIYGQGGIDNLVGGDGNDHLFGGSDGDTLKGGSGNDTIWGGDKNEKDFDSVESKFDTVDYSESSNPIKITMDLSNASSSFSIEDGTGHTDTLYSIEKLIGTTGDDKIYMDGRIPNNAKISIDAKAGQHDLLSFKGYLDTKGFKLGINNDGTGGVIKNKSGGNGTITLSNFKTDIIGSDYADDIEDQSDSDHKIHAGDGDDIITVGGHHAIVGGEEGDDVIHHQFIPRHLGAAL